MTSVIEQAAALSPTTLLALEEAGLEAADVLRAVQTALTEDFRHGADVTSAATVTGRVLVAAHCGGDPHVVLEDPELALLVADEVDDRDVAAHAAGRREPDDRLRHRSVTGQFEAAEPQITDSWTRARPEPDRLSRCRLASS